MAAAVIVMVWIARFCAEPVEGLSYGQETLSALESDTAGNEVCALEQLCTEGAHL